MIDNRTHASQRTVGTDAPVAVGSTVYVRTVTHHYTGRVAAVSKRWLHLTDAAWIADSGRWSDALSEGTLNEVEPYPHGVVVSLGAVCDIAPWNHPLPTEQK